MHVRHEIWHLGLHEFSLKSAFILLQDKHWLALGPEQVRQEEWQVSQFLFSVE